MSHHTQAWPKRFAKALSAGLLMSLSAAAMAQAYPARPIRLVVPWPPGQATDLAARFVAQKLSESLGQPLVVDNRAGAGGTIGSDVVAKAPPDGYTLLAGSSGPISIAPYLSGKLPYESLKDFTAVSLIATVPYVLVTQPAFPASNAAEFVAAMRASPGKYSFASSGAGATSHLTLELFNMQAQVKATHIPYKGATPALTDVINGQVAYTFETLAAVVGHVRSGRLKALAMSSARRNAALPDVPTVAEAAGLPGFDMAAWIGYVGPAGLPRDVAARLSAEIGRALQAADLRERYATLGMEAVGTTPEGLAQLMRTEDAKYANIIKVANIKVE